MYFIKKDQAYAVIVVGTGGTGSWLCSFLSKMDFDKHRALLIDGDLVEPKNVLRQNFRDSDVFQDKAVVVANTGDFAYVVDYLKEPKDLVEFVEALNSDGINRLPLIVGCLDNNGSRKVIHDYVQETADVIWLDAGNAELHGQTYVCIKEDGKILDGFESPLDLDTVFQNFEGDNRRPDQISCAEQSESAPQHVTANVASATLLFNLLAQFLTGAGVLMTNKYIFDNRMLSVQPQMKG